MNHTTEEDVAPDPTQEHQAAGFKRDAQILCMGLIYDSEIQLSRDRRAEMPPEWHASTSIRGLLLCGVGLYPVHDAESLRLLEVIEVALWDLDSGEIQMASDLVRLDEPVEAGPRLKLSSCLGALVHLLESRLACNAEQAAPAARALHSWAQALPAGEGWLGRHRLACLMASLDAMPAPQAEPAPSPWTKPKYSRRQRALAETLEALIRPFPAAATYEAIAPGHNRLVRDDTAMKRVQNLRKDFRKRGLGHVIAGNEPRLLSLPSA